MEEKICGKCSQEQGISLEDRGALARSRVLNQVYQCPFCKQEHGYRGAAIPPVPSIPSIPSIQEIERVTPKKSRDNQEEENQLTLF